MRFRLFLAIITVLLPATLQATDAPEVLPPPPYPQKYWMNGDWGKLALNVTFAPDGHVTDCQIQSRAVSEELAESTEQFITSHWRSMKNAGKVVAVPIVFSPPPSSHLSLPGYPAEAEKLGIQASFILKVVFDASGRAVNCTVITPNAPERLTKPCCAFILKNWQNPVFAGKTELVPLDFTFSQPPPQNLPSQFPYNLFPRPPYPREAWLSHMEGTVVVTIQFDGEGEVTNCTVVKSQSTAEEPLQVFTREFIKQYWHSKLFANKTETVPITYQIR